MQSYELLKYSKKISRKVFNMKNSLSIVILVYKSKKTILTTLKSITSQSNKNFELVFVNNASPDESIELIKKTLKGFPGFTYKIVNIDKNEGCGKGRTIGYKNSSGNYIKFLDSDDLLDSSYSEEIHKIIDYNSPDIITYGHKIVDEKGKIIRSMPAFKNKEFTKYGLTLFWRYTFKKQLALNANIDTSKFHYAEDRIFSLNLIPIINNIQCINKELYFVTRNPSGTTKQENPNKFKESNLYVFDLYKNLYKVSENLDNKKNIRYFITKFYVSISILVCKGEKQYHKELYALYKQKYLDCFDEKRFNHIFIIPNKVYNKEAIVIQLTYIIFRLHFTKLFEFIYSRFY